MSNHCVDCGSPIPDGQNTCSMCYGDLDYGKDGYYRARMEEQMQTDDAPDPFDGAPCPKCGEMAYTFCGTFAQDCEACGAELKGKEAKR